MPFTNATVSEFLDRYFKTFSKYGQDLENMHRMGDYFDDDLEFVQYYPETPHVKGLENFHKLNDHPHVNETLSPLLYVIDAGKKIVSVLINVTVVDTASGKVILTPVYNSIYHFKEYEDGSFKISKIWLFVEHSEEYAQFLSTLPKG